MANTPTPNPLLSSRRTVTRLPLQPRDLNTPRPRYHKAGRPSKAAREAAAAAAAAVEVAAEVEGICDGMRKIEVAKREEQRYQEHARREPRFVRTGRPLELSPLQWVRVREEMAKRGGFTAVQEWQWGTARDLADGISAVTIAPTGAGKSTIWQILSLAVQEKKKEDPDERKMVVLLSVTKAMMDDQISTLRRLAIDAHAVNADSITDDLENRFLAADGELFALTPEMLIKNQRIRKAFVDPVFRSKVVAVIMDEAHTLRTWGTTFRPDLARLDEICLELGSEIAWGLISATLPEPELLYAAETLSFPHRPFTVRDVGVDRDELFYEIRPFKHSQNSYRDLFFLIRPDPISTSTSPSSSLPTAASTGLPPSLSGMPACGSSSSSSTPSTLPSSIPPTSSSHSSAPLPSQQFRTPSRAEMELERRAIPLSVVFIKERNSCREAAGRLKSLLPDYLRDAIDVFHAACSATQRLHLLERMKNGDLRIIVATEAFGIGCDISGIANVIQYGTPESLVSLLQHWGRGGRVGGGGKGSLAAPVRCLWLADAQLFGPLDRAVVREMEEDRAAVKKGKGRDGVKGQGERGEGPQPMPASGAGRRKGTPQRRGKRRAEASPLPPTPNTTIPQPARPPPSPSAATPSRSNSNSTLPTLLFPPSSIVDTVPARLFSSPAPPPPAPSLALMDLDPLDNLRSLPDPEEELPATAFSPFGHRVLTSLSRDKPSTTKKAAQMRARLHLRDPALFDLLNLGEGQCIRSFIEGKMRPDVKRWVEGLGGCWWRVEKASSSLPPERCCCPCFERELRSASGRWNTQREWHAQLEKRAREWAERDAAEEAVTVTAISKLTPEKPMRPVAPCATEQRKKLEGQLQLWRETMRTTLRFSSRPLAYLLTSATIDAITKAYTHIAYLPPSSLTSQWLAGEPGWVIPEHSVEGVVGVLREWRLSLPEKKGGKKVSSGKEPGAAQARYRAIKKLKRVEEEEAAEEAFLARPNLSRSRGVRPQEDMQDPFLG